MFGEDVRSLNELDQFWLGVGDGENIITTVYSGKLPSHCPSALHTTAILGKAKFPG